MMRARPTSTLRIGVFGAGRVGLVTAACLADIGHEVVCWDNDAERVAGLRRGELPPGEPELAPMLGACLANGRLAFSADPRSAIDGRTLIFVCVEATAAADGSADVRPLLVTAQMIGRHLQRETLIAVRSTVPVGTCERVTQSVLQELRQRRMAVPFVVAHNPDFLREGSAVNDFMHPDRVVIGCDHPLACARLRNVFAPFVRRRDALIAMDLRSAELAKAAANAMLATRISFMNEIAGYAEAVGADIECVRRALGTDPRIGGGHLHAGIGWGGPCLPKDTAALAAAALAAGQPMPLLDAVRTVNERQQRWPAERIIGRFGPDLSRHRIGVWGLAFRSGAPALEASPGAALVDTLLRHGARVKAYDALAGAAAQARWGEAVELCSDPAAAADGASALAITCDTPAFRTIDLALLRHRLHEPVIVDGRNLFDPARMATLGFSYHCIGRARAARPAPLRLADAA
jgi:UDPglucose 6-dehydrogenase